MKDFDYIPAPRLFKIFMILKEEGLEPKVIQLGLRLIADDQDLSNCIEDYKEKSSFFSEIPRAARPPARGPDPTVRTPPGSVGILEI